MKKLLPLFAIVGLLTMSLGCHHTTKVYDDRGGGHDFHPDFHHDDHHDYH